MLLSWLNMTMMMVMNKKDFIQKLIFTVLFLLLIINPLKGRNYYIYVTAESQDEVHVVKFDGKKAVVIKDIPVGVWPLEIEGPHGLTISPMENIGIYPLLTDSHLAMYTNMKLVQIRWSTVWNWACSLLQCKYLLLLVFYM
ncbi:MAG: hypothetical protein CM1200mP10_04150 [Candidatus Neomarinimicrobiota bacterium]|nr:MAG: hypothetical protein CM1200mP10_04150 [Candidatus Neomarinimicrobiota bacterium]